MMWIVRVALRRPYTFVSGAILVLIAGVVAILTTPVDIFPAIPLPVVTVIWQYNGMSPEEMEERIVSIVERSYSVTVNDIEHIESQSLTGVAVIKVFFQPTADVATGVAQLTAVSQSNTRTLPPGTTPPIILRFNATDVPVLQIGVGSSTMTSAELNDYVLNVVRPPLASAQGASIPYPYGGAPRVINVDLDLARLYAKGLSTSDVSAAVNAENVILPAGSAKLGTREYNVRLNSSPDIVGQLNDMPIKQVNGAMVYIRDVAQVRDGAGVQTNIVRQNGAHGVYLTLLKTGHASTLAVVNQVKALLAQIKPSLAPGLDVQYLVDQSLFVRASITGVIREAVIAACLTALMILLFLGSWRSTLIIVPTMAHYLLAADAHRLAAGRKAAQGVIERVSARFETGFERFRGAYRDLLGWALEHRRLVLGAAAGVVALGVALVPFVGEDFFPTTDAGAFQLHVRAPVGTRVEQTELIGAGVERAIRRVIPPAELSLVLSNVGINRNAINLATSASATLNAEDADVRGHP